tara:strand:+ start:938 stop:1294 length:357 start_codon:yes stop_codon:yes gene_type:complete
MQNSITKNNALDFDDEQWSQLINANGLLIMWFIEWNKGDRQDANILEFFARKYQQSAGCEPYPMGGKVSLDGKYVSRDDDDLEPYFLINTPDGVGYIYPYAFVALPKKSGGHHIVRMD